MVTEYTSPATSSSLRLSLKNCIILKKNPKPGNSSSEVKHFRAKPWRWLTNFNCSWLKTDLFPMFGNPHLSFVYPPVVFQLDQVAVHTLSLLCGTNCNVLSGINTRKEQFDRAWWKKPQGIKSSGSSLPVCSSQTTRTGCAVISSSPVNSYSQMYNENEMFFFQ